MVKKVKRQKKQTLVQTPQHNSLLNSTVIHHKSVPDQPQMGVKRSKQQKKAALPPVAPPLVLGEQASTESDWKTADRSLLMKRFQSAGPSSRAASHSGADTLMLAHGRQLQRRRMRLHFAVALFLGFVGTGVYLKREMLAPILGAGEAFLLDAARPGGSERAAALPVGSSVPHVVNSSHLLPVSLEMNAGGKQDTGDLIPELPRAPISPGSELPVKPVIKNDVKMKASKASKTKVTSKAKRSAKKKLAVSKTRKSSQRSSPAAKAK